MTFSNLIGNYDLAKSESEWVKAAGMRSKIEWEKI